MVDGLVSDFGSPEYHPHVLSVSVCVFVCVCVALVQASPAIRKKNLLEQVSKDLLGAVTGSWQPSLPPSISLFSAFLNGWLSVRDIKYSTAHSTERASCPAF